MRRPRRHAPSSASLTVMTACGACLEWGVVTAAAAAQVLMVEQIDGVAAQRAASESIRVADTVSELAAPARLTVGSSW